jgi:hypothetical protein
MSDYADRQSLMGMPSKGVLKIPRMQELDVTDIISAPELRPFSLKQLLFSTIHTGPPSILILRKLRRIPPTTKRHDQLNA